MGTTSDQVHSHLFARVKNTAHSHPTAMPPTPAAPRPKYRSIRRRRHWIKAVKNRARKRKDRSSWLVLQMRNRIRPCMFPVDWNTDHRSGTIFLMTSSRVHCWKMNRKSVLHSCPRREKLADRRLNLLLVSNYRTPWQRQHGLRHRKEAIRRWKRKRRQNPKENRE